MKSDKLTSFALVIAAVALLFVGAMSYRDYLKAKFEKEFSESAAAQVPATQGNQESLPPGGGSTLETPPSTAPAAGTPSEYVPPAAPQPLRPATPPAGAGASGLSPAAPAPPAPSATVAASDARLNQYKENLEALQRENELYRLKLEQAKNSPGDPGPIPPSTQNRDPGMPSSAVAAVPGSPAPSTGSSSSGTGSLQQPDSAATGNVDQEISALAEKVRREASVAKVLEYDSDWAFLIIDGGIDVGIEEEMRFAVRRGGEILGWIKITEVEQSRAVAQLMSQNKNSQTSRKPARGDDIIAFRLF